MRSNSMNNLLYLAGFALLLALPAGAAPVVTTFPVSSSNVFSTRAYGVGGSFTYTTYNTSEYATATGICLSTSANPTTADRREGVSEGRHGSGGRGSGSIGGLTPATTYHVRYFLTDSKGMTYYGKDESFTTLAAIIPPVVSTAAVSSITASGAVCGGEIVQSLNVSGNVEVLSRGVCWGTSANPTLDDSKTYHSNLEGRGSGSFTWTITRLAPSTTYHVRAFASYGFMLDGMDRDNHYAYGEDVTFTTLAAIIPPVVTTAAVSSVTASGAVCGGIVTSDGGDNVTARGVCWSTSANPTTADARTSDGTGTGSFASAITGLAQATTYHVRAYAINSAGTAYGEAAAFTTAAASVPTTTSTNPTSSPATALPPGPVVADMAALRPGLGADLGARTLRSILETCAFGDLWPAIGGFSATAGAGQETGFEDAASGVVVRVCNRNLSGSGKTSMDELRVEGRDFTCVFTGIPANHTLLVAMAPAAGSTLPKPPRSQGCVGPLVSVRLLDADGKPVYRSDGMKLRLVGGERLKVSPTAHMLTSDEQVLSTTNAWTPDGQDLVLDLDRLPGETTALVLKPSGTTAGSSGSGGCLLR